MLKSLFTLKIFTLISALFLTLFGLFFTTTEVGFNYSARLSSQPHFWLVQISTAPRSVEVTQNFVTSPFEKILRSLGPLQGLSLFSYKNKVIASFYTNRLENPAQLKMKLLNRAGLLKDIPGLGEHALHAFYKPFSQPFAGQLPKAATDSLLTEDLESAYKEKLHWLFGVNGTLTTQDHIFSVMPADLQIAFLDKDGTTSKINFFSRNFQAFLEELEGIPGIQHIIAHNASLPLTEVHYNGPTLLQAGLMPGDFHTRLSELLEPNLSVRPMVFSRQLNVSETYPKNPADLSQALVALPDGREQRLNSLAMVRNEQLFVKTLPLKFRVWEYADLWGNSHTKNTDRNQSVRSPTDRNPTEIPTLSILLAKGANPQHLESAIKQKLTIFLAANPQLSADVNISASHTLQALAFGLFSCGCLVALFLLFSVGTPSSPLFRCFVSVLISALFYAAGLAVFRLPIEATHVLLFMCVVCLTILGAWFERYRVKGATQETLPLLANNTFVFFVFFVISMTLAALLLMNGSEELDTFNIARIALPFAAGVLGSATGFHGQLPAALVSPRQSLSFKKPFVAFCILGATLFFGMHSHRQNTSDLQPGVVYAEVSPVHDTSNVALRTFAEQIFDFAHSRAANTDLMAPLFENHLVISASRLAPLPVGIDKIIPTLAGFGSTPLGWMGDVDVRSLAHGQRLVVSHDDSGFQVSPEAGSKSLNAHPLETLRRWSGISVLSRARLMEVPKIGKGEDDLVKLESLIEFEKDRWPARSLRSHEAQTVNMKFLVPTHVTDFARDVQTEITRRAQTQFGRTKSSVRTSSEIHSAARTAELKIVSITAVLLFFFSATFFSSVSRACLVSLTFCGYYGIAFACTELTTHLFPSHSLPMHERGPFMLLSAGLFTSLWASLLTTSDSIRKANRSLEEANAPVLQACWRITQGGLAVVLLALAAGMFSHSERFALTTGLFALVACVALGGVAPGWILGWAHFAEHANRFVLSALVRLKHQRTGHSFRALLMLLILCPLIGIEPTAFAQKDLSTIDVHCDSIGTAILPIIGRPKGKEEAPQRAIFTERLAQETPCAWIETGLSAKISNIVQKYRGSAEQNRLIQELDILVGAERARIDTVAQKRLAVRSSPKVPMQTRIYGGFYEEFYGNISFTIIEFRKNAKPVLVKATFSEANQTQGIAVIAASFRGESFKLFEEILGENQRIPVYLEPVESLDKHPISENLAQEMDLFLRSRLVYPLSSSLLERKTFFRAEEDRTVAKQLTSVKIRRDGTRFYASIHSSSLTDHKSRTAWVEGDVSQLPAFEEDVLAALQKTLAANEGIADYCFVMSADLWVRANEFTRLYGVALRQNLGNAAFSLRLRTTDRKKAVESDPNQSILMAGAAGGWQFADIRWLVADVGFGLDAGLLTVTSPSAGSSRTLMLAYGPFIQSEVLFAKNFALLGRAGVEVPTRLDTTKEIGRPLPGYVFNVSLGLGVAF